MLKRRRGVAGVPVSGEGSRVTLEIVAQGPPHTSNADGAICNGSEAEFMFLEDAEKGDKKFQRLGTYTCRLRVASGVVSFEDVLSAWTRRRRGSGCH